MKEDPTALAFKKAYALFNTSDLTDWLQTFIDKGPLDTMYVLNTRSKIDNFALTTQLLSVLFELGYQTGEQIEEAIDNQ